MWQIKKERKGLSLLFLFVIVALVVVGCGKDQEHVGDAGGIDIGLEPQEIVAKYEGGQVSTSEFEQYLSFLMYYYYPENEMITDKTYWNDYLTMYVGQKYILDRAKENNLNVDAAEWDEVYAGIKEAITSILENGLTYEQLLANYNLTEQQVKDQIHDLLLFSEYFYSLKSDEELKAIYDENPEYYTYASVRHILISTEERSDEEALALATELANRIRSGEDFATLAKEYTDDSNGEQGGLYEDQPVYLWVEPFKVATLTLPLNEVSDPVKTEYGYHVIRVESREILPFEEVKEQIAAQEGRNAYSEFVTEKLDTLIIENNLPTK